MRFRKISLVIMFLFYMQEELVRGVLPSPEKRFTAAASTTSASTTSAQQEAAEDMEEDEEEGDEEGEDGKYEDDLSGSGQAKGKRGRPRKHAPKIPLPPLYVFIRDGAISQNCVTYR
jgi:hypothetical protein